MPYLVSRILNRETGKQRVPDTSVDNRTAGAETLPKDRIRLTFFTEGQEFGGAEQYLVMLLDLLPREEFELACICTYKETLSALTRRVSRKDVDFIFFNRRSHPSIWKTVWPLYRVIASLRPDIVHCSPVDGYAGSYAILASRLAGVPVVLGTFHTAMRYPHCNLFEKLFGVAVDRLLDGGIAVSKSNKELVLEQRHLAPEKLTLIYNGVPIPEISTAVEADSTCWDDLINRRAVTIGTSGRLVPRKDIGTFLRAAALLKNVDNIRFIIIGDGPDKGNLIRMTSRLGLTELVTFAGWQESILPALQGLDIFVLSSVREAFGLVIVEAMACGLPVIATRVGGVPEVVVDGQTGLLVPPKDPQALADAIHTLVADPNTRKAMGNAGRLRAMTLFSAERMVEQTRLYYHWLLRRKRIMKWGTSAI